MDRRAQYRSPGHTACAIAGAVLLAVSTLPIAGCWRSSTPAPTEAPPTATPVAPTPAPQARAATPATPTPQPPPARTPRPAPQPQQERKPVSLAELTARANPLSLEHMRYVRAGMTLDEVNRMLGKDGEMFSSESVDNEIYRWSDESGASIVAKFENGKLVRKSTILPEGGEMSERTDDDPGGALLTKTLYDKVRPGMTVDEIQNLLNIDRRVVSDYDAKVTMYEWVDSKGANFFARFEDGRMTRKTGFHVAPVKADTPPEEESADTRRQGQPPAETAREDAPAPPERDEPDSLVDEQYAEDIWEGEFVEDTAPPRGRVAVVGGARDGEDRSFRPRAKFPAYTWQFRRGNYEIKIVNTADMRVKVGLRSGNHGKDLQIAPGRSASVKVDQGTYTLYFQYEDEPHNIYTGESFDIDGMLVADVEVQVFNEAYDIGILNRAHL